MWRGGCIIRSRFLGEIKKAFDKTKDLKSLLLDDFFRGEIMKAEQGWRRVVSHAAEFGVPAPCFSTSLSFFDGYRSSRLPANLLQAIFSRRFKKKVKAKSLAKIFSEFSIVQFVGERESAAP